MEGYLGETEVDVSTHPVYSKYTQSDWAMVFIEMYGQIDGDHHKTWVLDQVARILKGTPVTVTTAKWDNGQSEDRFVVGEPTEQYNNWAHDMLGEKIDDEDFEYEYSYDCGTAP
jgi:hypothetical protein